MSTLVKMTSAEMMKEVPSGDFLPPLGKTTKDRKRSRARAKKNNPVTKVLPAELLLDEEGRMAVAVGEQAVTVAALGGEPWPLPEELLLLLEPVLQPEVLAKVGQDDQ